MKIVSAKEMARIEALSYSQNAKDQETKFMEAAGQAIAQCFLPEPRCDLGPEKKVFLLCGKGNNAGDAYVAGRYLQEQGYSVTALQVFDKANASHLTQANLEKFTWVGGTVINPEDCMEFQFPQKGILLDGLLGTGFHGPVSKELQDIICKANSSGLPIIAIDVPSGLDASTGEFQEDAIIKAKWTVSLQLPKSGFFLKDAWNYVGQLSVVPFGLEKEIIQKANADFSLLSETQASKLLPTIKRTRHKYQRGALAILAGSPGMSGAAILASHASLRTGAGIVRLIHSEDIRVELAQAPIELLKFAYAAKPNRKIRNEILTFINNSNAALLGPGLGRSKEVRSLLKELLPQIKCPTLLDADALNLLAEENYTLPPQTLITPHTGEMARLLGMKKAPPVSLDFLKQCQKYADTKNVTIVLKGAPTFILHPSKIPYVCTKGDPGMATAGSGDVLAGVLSSLLAQGLSALDAALLGTYLHGLAGELSAKEKTSYAMIASDLLSHIPQAFRSFLSH